MPKVKDLMVSQVVTIDESPEIGGISSWGPGFLVLSPGSSPLYLLFSCLL